MAPTTSASSKMVANPLHQALSKLYQNLQRDADTMKNALRNADQQMAGGDTWVGPAARSWGSQLSGKSRDCTIQVTAMLAEVESFLASEPAEVTEKELPGKYAAMRLLARGY